jgi:hypothetical protein
MAQDFFYYIAATASRGWLTCSNRTTPHGKNRTESSPTSAESIRHSILPALPSHRGNRQTLPTSMPTLLEGTTLRTEETTTKGVRHEDVTLRSESCTPHPQIRRADEKTRRQLQGLTQDLTEQAHHSGQCPTHAVMAPARARATTYERQFSQSRMEGWKDEGRPLQEGPSETGEG